MYISEYQMCVYVCVCECESVCICMQYTWVRGRAQCAYAYRTYIQDIHAHLVAQMADGGQVATPHVTLSDHIACRQLGAHRVIEQRVGLLIAEGADPGCHPLSRSVGQ